MAQIIYADGTVIITEPLDTKEGFSLEELYKIIETDIVQTFTFNDGNIIIMDEEGKLKNKPYNEKATKIFLEKSFFEDVIVGTVVICSSAEFK